MDRMRTTALLLVAMVFGFLSIGRGHADTAAPKPQAARFDRKQVERGRYLSRIAGCNDCHRAVYLLEA